MEKSEEVKEPHAIKKKRKNTVLWLAVFIICALVASACLGVWVYHAILRRTMNELYKEVRIEIADMPIKPDYITAPVTSEDGAEEIVGEENVNGEETPRPLAVINFPLLKETSPDVYAWIEIPGTKIAYPIVQHPVNNGYYLRRAINGAYDITGCIYTQNYNKIDFSDANTLIYGHYMNDGTKFGQLLSYMDEDFFESHRRIDVYTENHWQTYEVFAALPFDTRHVLRGYRWADDPLGAFLSDVYKTHDARAVIDEDYPIDSEKDKIITLSTCLKNSSKRYLVLAKLVRSQICE
ncbi:MAG: class B sortase [Clostridia bacterium]|nr:class B sortase [Clostridia bacterium]